MRLSSTTVAILIAIVTVAWLGSGLLTADPAPEAAPTVGADAPTAVRGRVTREVTLAEQVLVRGQTENKRTVRVRAETDGRVVARPVERGDRARAGDLLCQLALDDRPARLAQAEAAVEQARLEHQGILRLRDQGLQSETAIAQAKARLTAAQAQREAAALEVDRARIRAPFDGVIEDVRLEVGDYAQTGAPCAVVVQLDPMLLVGRVSETDAHRITVGDLATARLATGRTVTGPVSFVGRQADAATRTYRVEVRVSNPDYAISSGITARFEIQFGELRAHKLSPATLALNDSGRLGVRLVDGNNRVIFNPVTIVRDEDSGVWVTGLPPQATLITVGHQLVTAGERVTVQLQDAPADADGGGQPAVPLAASRNLNDSAIAAQPAGSRNAHDGT